MEVLGACLVADHGRSHASAIDAGRLPAIGKPLTRAINGKGAMQTNSLRRSLADAHIGAFTIRHHCNSSWGRWPACLLIVDRQVADAIEEARRRNRVARAEIHGGTTTPFGVVGTG